MSLDPATRERIEGHVGAADVVLFMKGHRGQPQCGFSATVIRILDALVPSYATVDVLSDAEVREGIKHFSQWPTIPQLYVKGEFVGGCDIVQELFESGELHDLLGVSVPEGAQPAVTVTEAAAEGLRRATEQAGGEGELRLQVDASFRSALSLGPRHPGDIAIESGGVTLLLDSLSATRADGIVVDVAQGPSGPGFTVDNPNAPRVSDISVAQLKELLDAGHDFELIDVRTPEERAKASIQGSVLHSEVEAQRLQGLSRDTPLIFFCHHGGRSQAAAEHYAALGFERVHNVVGGIDAWSQEIDSSVPRY